MTRKTLSNCLALFGLLFALAVSFGDALIYGKSMTVTVSGLRSTQGVVHVLVYDNAGSFRETSLTDLVDYQTRQATSPSLSITLSGIQAGTYALTVHHDENANNAFEYDGQTPLEGWGYSNNVGKAGMPDFGSAAFAFDADSTEQNITINYAN